MTDEQKALLANVEQPRLAKTLIKVTEAWNEVNEELRQAGEALGMQDTYSDDVGEAFDRVQTLICEIMGRKASIEVNVALA